MREAEGINPSKILNIVACLCGGRVSMSLSPFAGSTAPKERKSAEDLKGLSSLLLQLPNVARYWHCADRCGFVFSDKDKQAAPKGQ